MKNYKQEGDVLDLVAPYAVTSGQGMLIGSLFAVAIQDAANGAAVQGLTEGVVTLAKATGAAWTLGAKLYWDNTNKNVTTTSAGNTLIGCAALAAASGDTTGDVFIDGCLR